MRIYSEQPPFSQFVVTVDPLPNILVDILQQVRRFVAMILFTLADHNMRRSGFFCAIRMSHLCYDADWHLAARGSRSVLWKEWDMLYHFRALWYKFSNDHLLYSSFSVASDTLFECLNLAKAQLRIFISLDIALPQWYTTLFVQLQYLFLVLQSRWYKSFTGLASLRMVVAAVYLK